VSAARIAAASAAVLLVCLAAYRVRSGRPGRAALGLLLAALLALYASDQTAALPDGEHAVAEAGDALGAWTYPFMAAMALLAALSGPCAGVRQPPVRRAESRHAQAAAVHR